MAGAYLVLVAGCGGSVARTYDANEVQRAFGGAGIELRRAPSSGAEQPAMGITSGCAERYFALVGRGVVDVAVCESAEAARGAEGDVLRENVAVSYPGVDRATRERVARALDALG